MNKITYKINARLKLEKMIFQDRLYNLINPKNHINKNMPNLIFIAGLPKSGTTWLFQLLRELPGYHPAYVYDPDGCNLLHKICTDNFAHLPAYGHYVMKLHTEYSVETTEIFEKFNIKPIIMYRDLRDQCVSRYFHVLNDSLHRDNKLYSSLTKEEAMTHNIQVTIDYYMSWIENWLAGVKKKPEQFHEIKYEILRANPIETLSAVLSFFRITLSPNEIEQITQKVASQTKFDIKENFIKKSSTARKGIVGDWRNHFTENHVKIFKEKCGQHLIDVGYEKDLDWSLKK